MKTLALLLVLAAPPRSAAQFPSSSTAVAPAAAPKTGGKSSPKVGPDADDPAAALRDAEIAVRRGGGAGSYAARADAKRALGRPFEEFIADYAEAAKRDSRYKEKYEGLIDQRLSQTDSMIKKTHVVQEHDPNALAKLLGAIAVGVLILIALAVLFRGRETSV
jgi:hypothetical protein